MPQHADEELRRAALAAAHEFATKEPERWKASWDELNDVMGTLFGVLNLMPAFAAPCYLARGNPDKRPTPEQLLGLFDKSYRSRGTGSQPTGPASPPKAGINGWGLKRTKDLDPRNDAASSTTERLRSAAVRISQARAAMTSTMQRSRANP